jgi:hypothetical protein
MSITPQCCQDTLLVPQANRTGGVGVTVPTQSMTVRDGYRYLLTHVAAGEADRDLSALTARSERAVGRLFAPDLGRTGTAP